jgi:hypothetical protein
VETVASGGSPTVRPAVPPSPDDRQGPESKVRILKMDILLPNVRPAVPPSPDDRQGPEAKVRILEMYIVLVEGDQIPFKK